MIIPITLSTDTSNIKLPTALAQISHDEIILIELQGALDVGNSQPAERNGKFVGKLSIDDDGLVSCCVTCSSWCKEKGGRFAFSLSDMTAHSLSEKTYTFDRAPSPRGQGRFYTQAAGYSTPHKCHSQESGYSREGCRSRRGIDGR